jgi:hypothetical protein
VEALIIARFAARARNMEADRVNLIESNLQDLAARAQELRRFL